MPTKEIDMNAEDKIVYETEHFYAFQVKSGFEIRKNGLTHATVLGIAKTVEQAKRFIDRAEKYPEKF